MFPAWSRAYDYDLIDALRRNPTTVMAGDDICGIEADQIERLQEALVAIIAACEAETFLPAAVGKTQDIASAALKDDG